MLWTFDNIFLAVILMVGAVILGFSLRNINAIIRTIKVKRKQWQNLRAFILLFIFGYLTYMFGYLIFDLRGGQFITVLIFLVGALFVLYTTRMNLESIKALQQLSELERAAITDSLMDIYNRRFIDHQLETEIIRAERYQNSLAVLLLDVDHFKQVNDNYGHPAGDIALQRLAHLLKASVRTSDYVGRFGGEEVLVILPHSDAHHACALAEKLRRRIEKTALINSRESPISKPIYCTVSIGVAQLQKPHINDSKQLLNAVDKALYVAKNSGRNRVSTHAQL